MTPRASQNPASGPGGASNGHNVRWSFAGFTLAGLLSATVTAFVHPHVFRHGDPLGGAVFGASMAACFWLFWGLRSIWRTCVFIGASIVAAYLSVLSAVLVAGRLFPPGPPYEPDVFVGGFVGAFVLIATTLLLISPMSRIWRVLLASAAWSLAGGLLGIVGEASGDLFGRIRPHLAFVPVGEPDSDISLILVWQVGMSLVLALVPLLSSRETALAA